ncbi:MAG: hypothetical protein NTX61_02515 [Bacteroidetes bacterium]|nr:hypothetical protein [Bacteroidota bacterium]
MSSIIRNFYKSLAGYFQSKPLYLDEPTQKKPNTRKLVEQYCQQTKTEMWDEVMMINLRRVLQTTPGLKTALSPSVCATPVIV